MVKLFEYAIILQPKVKDDEVVEEGKLLQEPKSLLAKAEKEVLIVASREIPEEYMDDLDRVTVAVRPF